MYSWQRLMVLALWPNVAKFISKELCFILQGLQWYLILPTFCWCKQYSYSVPCSCWGPSKHYMHCAQRLMGSHTHNALPRLTNSVLWFNAATPCVSHLKHFPTRCKYAWASVTLYPTQQRATGYVMCFVELYNWSCSNGSWIHGINLTWDWTHCYVLSTIEITWKVIIVLLIYTQF